MTSHIIQLDVKQSSRQIDNEQGVKALKTTHKNNPINSSLLFSAKNLLGRHQWPAAAPTPTIFQRSALSTVGLRGAVEG